MTVTRLFTHSTPTSSTLSFSHGRQGEAALGEQVADLHAASHGGHGQGEKLHDSIFQLVSFSTLVYREINQITTFHCSTVLKNIVVSIMISRAVYFNALLY